jgi:heme exporter protein A
LTREAAVEAQGLCRRYGRRWALVDVSLRVPRGAGLLVAGRNGSGKSTLLRVLATAIRADRGSGRVAGHDLRHDAPGVRVRSALLSHASYLYDALSALENLRIVARFLGKDTRSAALLPLLERVGLAERADDPPATFSAGMRKRLALARVLLKDAELVMLDEPYGQLDPPGFGLIDAVVRGLRARGATVLIASHQLARAGSLCDEAIVLEAGRLAWSGAALEAAARGGLESRGLEEGGA